MRARIGGIRNNGCVATEETRAQKNTTKQKKKLSDAFSDRTINQDVQANQARLLPPGRQQNFMGSTGAVPGAEAGGDRGVRDGVVSGFPE